VEDDEQHRGRKCQERFLEVETLEEGRERCREEDRDRQPLARAISAREPPGEDEEQEAEDHRHAVRQLDDRERHGPLEERRSMSERRGGGARQEHDPAQEGVGSDRRAEERADAPARAQEAPREDQRREDPGQDVVDQPVEDQRGQDAVVAPRGPAEREEPERVRRAEPSGYEAHEAHELPQEEGAQRVTGSIPPAKLDRARWKTTHASAQSRHATAAIAA
jgi:hypothetical protein